jgi:hypothetical protein
MKRIRYNSDIKAEARLLFVENELSFEKISEYFNGTPTAQCIQQWATKPDKKSGKSWKDERREKADGKYLNLSPQAQANKIMERINFLLESPVESWDPRQADALAKTQKTLEKLVDKKFQIPMMFELLRLLVEFLKMHYPEFITPEFLNALRHFKNDKKKKLELGL